MRTPTPPAALPDAPWVAQTPSNARELEAQSSLIRERVRQHKSSSPASIIEAIDQLKKGAEPQRVGSALKGVYRSMELLMKSVKEERDQALASALKGAAPE
ncbi:hypothetical protein PtrEW13061_009468 [Pyrenophora tritici-repentis]|nr:hypothetical protein PtrEW13061_012346 [Pyrenophora tritici-repentis]KAI1565643.1 hypothetical protein PtrEW13061_011903 [Pyrenophora tritici-repentis]KAI1581859.1 hypothetical protein PtrEW13061_009468 [Pyrenophora tritici-repentis]